MGNVQNIMGVLYSCTTFLGMFNMMSVMPILGYERSVMYRSVILAVTLTCAVTDACIDSRQFWLWCSCCIRNHFDINNIDYASLPKLVQRSSSRKRVAVMHKDKSAMHPKLS